MKLHMHGCAHICAKLIHLAESSPLSRSSACLAVGWGHRKWVGKGAVPSFPQVLIEMESRLARVAQQMERGDRQPNAWRAGSCLGLFPSSQCPAAPPEPWTWEGCAGGQGCGGGKRPHLENDKERHGQHALHGLPCRRQGESVSAGQGRLSVVKGNREIEMLMELSSQAPGAAFAETEHQNQIVPRSILAGCPDSLPSPPLPPPRRGPRKEQTRIRGCLPFLGSSGPLRLHPGPDQPSRLSFN